MLVQLDSDNIDKLLREADSCGDYEGSLGVVCAVLRQVYLIEEYTRKNPSPNPFLSRRLVLKAKSSLEELFSRTLAAPEGIANAHELFPVTIGRRVVTEFRHTMRQHRARARASR